MKPTRQFWIVPLVLAVFSCGCLKAKSHRVGSDFSAFPASPPLIVDYNESGNPIYSDASPAAPSDGLPRMLARKASLSIEVPDVDKAVADAVAMAERCGGYVENRSDDSYSGTTLKLRIPSSAFTNAVGAAETLGDVKSRRMENEDVTEQYVDVEARLKNKIVLRDRLQALLDKATEVKDVLAIETELNRVQGDVDSMEARIKALKGRVNFARLDLNLSKKEVPPKKILGPLGYLFKGIFWTVEKLFVIRE